MLLFVGFYNVFMLSPCMFLDPDKSLNVFSSEGKLVQCENALKAAVNSALSIGCSSEDGCVIMSFKNLSSLVDKKNFHKVFTVCPSIGVTYSGLQPDFRAQLGVAQRICQDYYDVYRRFPFLDVFMNEFSLSVQEFSQKGGLRPFGTFLIFCGETRDGPCCYQMDPSGSFKKVRLTASGKEFEGATRFIERRIEKLDDNLVNCFLAIKEFVGKEIEPCDVSVGVFKTNVFKCYNEEEVKEVFDSVQN